MTCVTANAWRVRAIGDFTSRNGTRIDLLFTMSDITRILDLSREARIGFLTNEFRGTKRPHKSEARKSEERKSEDCLVEPDGIEPTTSCLQSRRSPN